MTRREWLALATFAALWIVSGLAIYLVATHGGP